jgi:hypothetical protein
LSCEIEKRFLLATDWIAGNYFAGRSAGLRFVLMHLDLLIARTIGPRRPAWTRDRQPPLSLVERCDMDEFESAGKPCPGWIV